MHGRESRTFFSSKTTVAAIAAIGGLAVLVAAVPAGARQAIPPQSGVPETIHHFEVVTGSGVPAAGGGAAHKAGRKQLAVSIRTLGRDFDLELEPNPIFAPGAMNHWVDDAGVVDEEPERIFYKGRVKGEADSWVRVAVRDGVLDGMVWTPDEAYFFEPADRYFSDAGAGDMVTYRLSDTDLGWGVENCGTPEDSHQRAPRAHSGEQSKGQAAYQKFVEGMGIASGGGAAVTLKQIDVSLIADFQHFQRHSTASASFVQNIINQVDGVYEREIGVALRISNTQVYTTSSDPFTETTVPSNLLNEFGAFRNNNDNSPGQVCYGSDLSHLFTGRDLDDTVVGIAWLSSVCSSSTGAGLSQDYTTTNNSLVSLTAHEMGHNLGAPHDNQTGSACASMPSGFIMNPSVTTVSDLTNLHFSSCSKTQIANHLSSRTCLTDVTGSDPTPTFTRTPTIRGTATRTPTATRTFTPTRTPIGGPSPNNAQFVSQSVPTQMTAGTQVQVSVTMKNTGVNAWTEANGYRLASRNPADNVTWGLGRVLLASTESIAANQQKTFTFTVTAPSTPGQYNFQWQMIREGVGSFGALSTNVVVTVAAPAVPLYKGDFVSQSVPTQMIMGHQYQVSVTMKNSGSNIWTAAENYRLGSTNPTDNVTWGLGRVFLDPSDAIATNQQKTFTFTVTAPTNPGQYNFQWWMVRDGFTYFGTPSTNVVVDVVSTAVAPYASEFVSQSVPTSMSPGQHVQVSVTMKNVGTNTWIAAENYRLGSTNPTDNVTWGLGRVLLAPTDAVATGDSKTFTFTVIAPSTPGQYNFQWWVVRDDVIYFGVVSDNVVVTVG